MVDKYPLTRVGELAASISETHNKNKDFLIFLNTSDVLLGKILHHTYSAVERWPGQAKKSIQRGDILFSEIRPENGHWAYVDEDAEDFVVSTKLMVIRGKKDRVFPKFLYQFLTAPSTLGWLQHLADSRSGTFPQITFDQVASLEIPLPPLSIQCAIARILGTLDDKIELNRKMNETLEAMGRALFKSWFVDFDPVRAKAEGRDTGLPKDIADFFPDEFEDSELGEIPKGWLPQTIRALASLNPEAWTKDNYPSAISYVDLSNTKWGRIEVVAQYPCAKAPSRAQRILRSGDTIIGTVRPGNGSYALITEDGLTGSTGFAVLRPNQSKYKEFVYFAATQQENIEALSHLADGGAYPAVRPGLVAATPITKPPDFILTYFSRVTEGHLALLVQNEREARTLAALRDALLPKLISGEIRVKGFGDSIISIHETKSEVLK